MVQKNLIKKLNKLLHTPKWLFLLLLVVLILRIPSFFEPYSYGDEMIYLILGNAIRRGITLYSHVHDNKPPLLYVMAAIAGNLFWFKAILAFWHAVTVYIFWKLSCTLFSKNLPAGRQESKLQKVSTVIFAIFTTIPLLEGNIANAELFMIGPTMLAFYILLGKKLTRNNLILSGVLFSIATLFKVPAAFDIPAIVFLWIVTLKRINIKNLKKVAANTLYLSLGFIAPIFLTLVWYWLKGAFNEYLVAAFLQNVGYLSSWRPDDVVEPFLVRNAPLLKRALIVAAGFAILFWKKKKLSKEFIFLTAWLLLTLFAVALSERPYPHYLIQSIPATSLLVGMLLTFETTEQSLVIIPLALFAFVPYYFNFWHYPTLTYYTRFINLATARVDKSQYLDSFGSHIQRDHKIANFLNKSTSEEELVFVWGDSSIIYALSERFPPIKYVADYHIKDFSNINDVIDALQEKPPSFIVILPNTNVPNILKYFVNTNYGLVETIDKGEIWKLLSTKIRNR